MRTLTERDVIAIMREEWDRRTQALAEELRVGGDEGLVSAELKVVHKDTGTLYTVDSVSPRDVILRTPEGDKFIVNGEEFEAEYKLS